MTRRPTRATVARSRWDCHPSWRWAWDGLIALYVPQACDGYTVPNLAGDASLALTCEAPPVYTVDGLAFAVDYGRAARSLPQWLYSLVHVTTLSMMWSGIETRPDYTGSAYTGYFGINPGRYDEPWHTFGFERKGNMSVASGISENASNFSEVILPLSSPGTLSTAVMSRRTTGYVNQLAGASSGAAGVYTQNLGVGVAWQHFGVGLSFIPQIHIANRWNGSLEWVSNPIITGLAAIWLASHSDERLLALARDPYAPFVRYRANSVFVGSDFAARVQANDSLKLRATTSGARATFMLG